MFLWLLTPVVSVPRHFGFYRIVKKIGMVLMREKLLFYRVNELDWAL